MADLTEEVFPSEQQVMDIRFDGKRALVTGAGRGGYACC